jgi:methylmalonyl-CoA mutase C-terminal domain/subunit
MPRKKIKVLVAKTGLESHTKGLEVVSQALRDAGMEVVYLGPLQTVQTVTQSAIAEDVDVIGLSFLGGQHLTQISKLFETMRETNFSVPVVVGGVIPKEDAQKLREMGVKGVFLPGSSTASIVEFIEGLVPSNRFN